MMGAARDAGKESVFSKREELVQQGELQDVESQLGNVHCVAMSMSFPTCLAWHVLSFLLGILTTVVVIWMWGACPVGQGVVMSWDRE
jgi:hypothetical protein